MLCITFYQVGTNNKAIAAAFNRHSITFLTLYVSRACSQTCRGQPARTGSARAVFFLGSVSGRSGRGSSQAWKRLA